MFKAKSMVKKIWATILAAVIVGSAFAVPTFAEEVPMENIIEYGADKVIVRVVAAKDFYYGSLQLEIPYVSEGLEYVSVEKGKDVDEIYQPWYSIFYNGTVAVICSLYAEKGQFVTEGAELAVYTFNIVDENAENHRIRFEWTSGCDSEQNTYTWFEETPVVVERVTDSTEQKYNLTYDVNGGKKGPGIFKGYFENEVIILDTETKPTHEAVEDKAVIFMGWAETKATSIYDRNDNAPENIVSQVTMGAEDKSVFAVWAYDANNNGTADYLEEKYTLTYYANGGSGAPAAVENLLDGEEVEVDTETKPTREAVEGKAVVFMGWSATEITDIYGANDTAPELASEKITMGSADKTLWAVWGYDSNGNGKADISEEKYTLTYDANGGSGTPAAVENLLSGQDVDIDTETKPAHEAVEDKAVVFVGWSETKTEEIADRDTAVPDIVSDNVTMGDENKTLWAVWAYDENNNGTADTSEEKYTLTYDANGGSGAPAAVSNLLMDEEIGIDADAMPAHEAVDGKEVVFMGWTADKNTAQAGENEKIYAYGEEISNLISDTVKIDGNKTVYAVWAYGKTYAVTVNEAENGRVSADLVADIQSGQKVTVTVEAAEGFELDELKAVDENENNVELTDKGDGTFEFTMPEANVSITATFKEKAAAFKPGDINNSGNVDGVDKAILNRYLAGWEGYDEYFVQD